MNLYGPWLRARFGRIGYGIFPVIWRHDLGLNASVLGEQVKQVRSVNELDWLVFSKVEACLPVPGCGYQDSLAGPLVLQGSE